MGLYLPIIDCVLLLMKHLFYSVIFFLFCVSCDDKENKQQNSSPRIKKLSRIASPQHGSRFSISKPISFEIEVQEGSAIDSVLMTYEGKVLHKGAVSDQITVAKLSNKVGRTDIDFTIYLSGGITERKRHSITLISDKKPIEYTYRVINEFPHDEDAFTQGLFIDDGQLFESTGQNGKSSLRQVNLNSGAIVRKIDLDSEFFGEGISLIGSSIYMLTYHAGRCFVFDKDSFEEKQSFFYAGEGWGMTAVNDTLVMTNGSEIVNFMEPEGFTEVKRIEVYDDKGPIDNINELEYIKGTLYANRWLTNHIYLIDPNTGIVEGVADLTGILSEDLKNSRTDVLNGIAYDHDTDRLFVTGKYWPRTFEIELIPKQNNI
jgi:glutamine cyclotransferase